MFNQMKTKHLPIIPQVLRSAAIATIFVACARATFGTPPAAVPKSGGHVVSNDEKKLYIDEQIRFAEGLRKRKHYDLAIEEYKRLVGRFKDNPIVAQAWANLARVLAEKGDYDAAFKTFDYFFKTFPDSRIFHATKLRRALALHSSKIPGGKKEAEKALTELEGDSKAPAIIRDAAAYHLASFVLSDGRTEEAMKKFAALAKLGVTSSPEHDFRASAAMRLATILAKRNKIKEAMAAIRPLVSGKGLSSDIRSRAMYALGSLALREKDYASADKLFAELAALFPSNALAVEASKNRLSVLFRLGDYQSVALESDKLLKRRDISTADLADIHALKGAALAKLGFDIKALKEFEFVLKSKFTSSETRRFAELQRVKTLLNSGNTAAALATGERIVNANPLDGGLACDVIVLLKSKAPPAKIEALLKKAVARLDTATLEGSSTRLQLASLLSSRGKRDEALKILDFVAEKGFPRLKPYATLAAARVLESKGDIAEALKKLEELVRTCSSKDIRPDAMLKTAVLLLRDEKQWDSAVAYLDEIGKKYPGTSFAAAAIFYKGFLEFQKGRWDAAEKILRQAVSPKNKELSPVLSNSAKVYLAWTFLRKKDFKQALAVAEKLPAEAFRSAPPAFLEETGRIALKNAHDLANRCFAALSASNDPVERQHGIIGKAKLAVAAGDSVKAIDIYKEASKMTADPVATNKAILALGELLAQRGNDDEAVLYIEKCLENPVDKAVSAKARLALAKILSKKPDRLKVANRYAMSVFVLSPNNDTCAEAMLLSAELSIRANNISEARDTFREFRKRFPDRLSSKRAKGIAAKLTDSPLSESHRK